MLIRITTQVNNEGRQAGRQAYLYIHIAIPSSRQDLCRVCMTYNLIRAMHFLYQVFLEVLTLS